MKVSVLYGSGQGEGYSAEVKYVGAKLGLEMREVWDGTSTRDYPDPPETTREELLSFVQTSDITFDPTVRFLHSIGKSAPEIVMAKHGKIEKIVDAVIFPQRENAAKILSKLLKLGYSARIFGGGTSVSGTLLVQGAGKIVSIDTSRFRGINIGDGYAIIGSGLNGKEAESELNRHGLTLGNFPESFEHSTVGGWVSTKAIGQESNQYGGMEQLTLGVKVITSEGEVEDRSITRESAGLGVKDIALGSDGRYGLISEVTLKTFHLPRKKYFSSRIYKSFKDGILELSKTRDFPTIARLSDELETELALKSAGDTPLVRSFKKYISLRGYSTGALLIAINNDFKKHVRIGNSMNTGGAPARSWEKGRFQRPAIGNMLWKRGLIPDTLETSAPWINLPQLYDEVRAKFYSARREIGFSGEIMAHLSHMYREGACIYFTFIIAHEDELATLAVVREAMIRAFIANGGSVTHHHGYGRFFSEYLDQKVLALQNRLRDPLFQEGVRLDP